ncbi:hypothetical protein HDE_07392 [Halotydeus destructor]|nr:hypothetical protein HDE_07392 [Halotydeus destructor]
MLKIIWVVTFLAFASPLSAVSTLSVPDKFNETGNATEDTSEDSDTVMHVHLANLTELVNSTSMAQTPIMIIGSFFRDLFLKLSFNMSFSPVFSFSPVITLNGPVSISMSQIPPAPSRSRLQRFPIRRLQQLENWCLEINQLWQDPSWFPS